MRLADSGGLDLKPDGSRRWFWTYRFGSREKRFALGHFTGAGSRKVSVSLKDARVARDGARRRLCAGTDPAQGRQLDGLTRQTVAGITFEAVARELHVTQHTGWRPRHAARRIGSLPLQDITARRAHTLRQTAGRARCRWRRGPSRCCAIFNHSPGMAATCSPACSQADAA